MWLNDTFVNLGSDDISELSGIMIPQLAALLAICVTVFVFLFTELNTRAQDHPGERLICNELQKDFALRVELLSIESILLITLAYCSERIYEFCIGDICIGHFLYALLVLESFWASICMIWYCVDVAQYQRHLKWRAWDLTKRRFNVLRDGYKDRFSNSPTCGVVSNFWSEYGMTSQLVCTIAGEQSEHAEMNHRVITRFEEVIYAGGGQTKSDLGRALDNLYDYQLALSVYEGYVFSDEYASDENARRYSPPPLSRLLSFLNMVLDFWNRKFRNRPTVHDDRIPGIASEDGEMTAAQIAQGLWGQIVQGNDSSYPMRSQRLHNMAFTGLNFNNAHLQNARMESCRFVGATFDHSNLRDAFFYDCDLRGASFKDVDCTNMAFESSNFSDVVITNNIEYHHENGQPILIPSDGRMLSNISFDSCTMERALFEPNDPGVEIVLSDSNFSNVNLQDGKIRHAKLDRCIFKNAWLSGAKFEGCCGESVDYSHALFIGSKEDSRLASCRLERCNMSSCTFSNARIDASEFPFLNAINTVFENVRLQHTSFVNAAFTNASFLYASLEDVSMEDTDLTHMHVIDSEIINCKFEGSAGDAFQILNGIVRDVTFLLAHLTSAEFSRTMFSDCNFNGSSLAGALFHRATLANTSFKETLLLDADFADATLEEVQADHAFFSSSIFDRAKLWLVNMTETDLTNVMFRHTTLVDCTFSSCTWSNTSFNNASLTRCRFSTSSRNDHDDLCRALSRASSLTNVTVDGETVGK